MKEEIVYDPDPILEDDICEEELQNAVYPIKTILFLKVWAKKKAKKNLL